MQRLIPAHAGKTRRLGRTRWRRPAHPRSRGENDKYWDAVGKSDGSSPLTRGKRNSGHNHPHGDRLIPAHAGKTPASQPCCPPSSAHPRSRGENLNAVAGGTADTGSSPLTRGKLGAPHQRERLFRLIPAHAGKTRVQIGRIMLPPAHPRSRGENSDATETAASLAGSSPLTRGKLRITTPAERRHRLIPAHAGKTRPLDDGLDDELAHPRSRGENPFSR